MSPSPVNVSRQQRKATRIWITMLLLAMLVVAYFLLRKDYVLRAPPKKAFATTKAVALKTASRTLRFYGINSDTSTVRVARRDQWLVAFPSQDSSSRAPPYHHVAYVDVQSGRHWRTLIGAPEGLHKPWMPKELLGMWRRLAPKNPATMPGEALVAAKNATTPKGGSWLTRAHIQYRPTWAVYLHLNAEQQKTLANAPDHVRPWIGADGALVLFVDATTGSLMVPRRNLLKGASANKTCPTAGTKDKKHRPRNDAKHPKQEINPCPSPSTQYASLILNAYNGLAMGWYGMTGSMLLRIGQNCSRNDRAVLHAKNSQFLR